LPRKRYATFEIAAHCRKVFDQNLSLRKAVSNTDRRPIFHSAAKTTSDDQPALSHSTIHRWLSFFGAMTISLQMGTKALLQAMPDSVVHRFAGLVDPKRSRSEKRLEVLSAALRLLHLQTLWDRHFSTTPFFARFATVARPP
jgi:hypothetical protein